MVQKICMYLGCALVFFATITQCKGGTAYDPSTVINVYPSLQKIKNGAARHSGSDYDYDHDHSLDDYDDSKAGPGSFGTEDPCLTDSCAAASNVKNTWMPKNDEKESMKAGPALTAPAKLPDQKMYEGPKMMKPAIKGAYMKGEQQETSAPMDTKAKLSLLSKLKAALPRKNRQQQDNPDSDSLKQYKWSSFQEMLQLLKNRKN